MSTDQLSRMISFRLSADEYDRCRQACQERGIASVSEFFRNAIDQLCHQATQSQSLDNRLSAVEQRLADLSSELESVYLAVNNASSVTA